MQLRVRLLSPEPPGLEMSIADGAWRPFVDSQPMELPAGDGVKKVVERRLTDVELAGLKEAAEAVRAKQADVANL